MKDECSQLSERPDGDVVLSPGNNRIHQGNASGEPGNVTPQGGAVPSNTMTPTPAEKTVHSGSKGMAIMGIVGSALFWILTLFLVPFFSFHGRGLLKNTASSFSLLMRDQMSLNFCQIALILTGLSILLIIPFFAAKLYDRIITLTGRICAAAMGLLCVCLLADGAAYYLFFEMRPPAIANVFGICIGTAMVIVCLGCCVWAVRDFWIMRIKHLGYGVVMLLYGIVAALMGAFILFFFVPALMDFHGISFVMLPYLPFLACVLFLISVLRLFRPQDV